MTLTSVVTSSADDGTLFAHPCDLERVIVGKAEAATTLTIHDAADATNPVATIALDEVRTVELGIRMRTALHVVTDATDVVVSVVLT